MLVKICGITNVADARQSLDSGADWIGLNLVAGPRLIALDRANAIVTQLDAPDRAVALLRVTPDGMWREPLQFLAEVGVGAIQWYGPVDAEVLAEAKKHAVRSILVHHISDATGLDELNKRLDEWGETRPDYLLFDASDRARLGGTGRTLDWASVAASLTAVRPILPPIILAGGLTPDNVATAIAHLLPHAVDVSSGVESSPGAKDADKVRAFITAAKAT